MLDQMGYVPARPIEERVRDLMDDPLLSKFKRLAATKDIVRQTAEDVPTGSLVGYMMYGRVETLKTANLRLLLYATSIVPRFHLTVRHLMAIARFQKRVKKKFWMPGGELYERLSKSTRVGKNKKVARRG